MEKFSENKTSNGNDLSFMNRLGIEKNNKGCFTGKRWCGSEKGMNSVNPATDEVLGYTSFTSTDEYEETIKNMEAVRERWAHYPMPKRGDIVREIGEELRKHLNDLGSLLAIEVGKIFIEGVGEIQEIIDICDYAVGLSRTLAGKVLPSERPDHVLYEKWNPLGLMGVITAFNFPAAVFGWNAGIALVCGDLVMLKGSESVSLINIAVIKIMSRVLEKYDFGGVVTLVSGHGHTIGERMINDKRIPLISFTGSTKVGKHVSKTVHGRLGRTILELGGNNCCIVMDDAYLENALPQIVFGAVGTTGQRCTTIRRALIHEKIYDDFMKKLVASYKVVKIGDPLKKEYFCGPLHNKRAVEEYHQAIKKAQQQGGKLIYGGENYNSGHGGNFVLPTIIEINMNAQVCQEEVFVPILYISKISSFEEAVKINNSVSQGLSSALFTNRNDLIQKWTSPLGSDTGLVNVNVGTSGAEIGGGFGGEKETGGGRESGGEAWRQYMKQQTTCLNYGKKVSLAQGIEFPKF